MTLFYWLCVPTVSGGACQPVSRADVAVAFLHVTSVDVAFLHAGSLLSVQKRHGNGRGRLALSKRAVYFSLIK